MKHTFGFFTRNHSDVFLFPLENYPWLLDTPDLPEFRTKGEYRKWCLDDKTTHVFFTFVEPVDPTARVSEDNPALKIHGLTADWDSATEVEEALGRIAKIDPDLRPQFMGKTFSGHLRAVWLFAEPVWADCPETAKLFVREFFATCKARTVAGGFDDASLSLHMTWELGRDWVEIEDTYPVPTPILNKLWFDAVRKVKKVETPHTDIPLPEIEEEINRQFPNRLFGAKIEVGNRIPLFWLPLGDGKERDKSGIVAPWGIYSFSSRADRGRMFWDEILGADFVRKYKERRIDLGAGNTYYDGHNYWWPVRDGWMMRNKDDSILALKNQGFAATREEGATASEVEQILYAIQQTRTIDAALPFTHTREEFIDWNGQHFLNTNTRHPMQPGPEGSGARENFPWLAEYFDNFLDRPEREVFHPKTFFLAELQRAYQTLLNGEPASKHCLILAGPVGRGKSFLTTVILRKMFGSGADAGGFLVEGKGFNKELAGSYLWYIDDNKSATTASQHRSFSENLKKHIATPEVVHRAMYSDGFVMPWFGLIVMTCNDDPESLGLLPDLDINIRDKLCLFQISDWQAPFFTNAKMEEIVDRELPYFLRWLMDEFVPDEEILTPDKPRYGLVPYHHPKLTHVAHESSSSNRMAEVLDIWREQIRDAGIAKQNPDGSFTWVGTATEILSSLGDFDATKTLVRTYSPISFGRALTALDKTEVCPWLASNIRLGHRSKKANLWTVTIPPQNK